MIIGVDAGMLGQGDDRLKAGVWRVAVNLLSRLAELDATHTYRLYSFTPISKALMRAFGSRMENRVLRPTTAWFRLRLPLELQVHPVDVFLGLAQAIPAGPGPKIGFVYDLGFLHKPDLYPDSAPRLTGQTRDLVGRADRIITISHASKREILKRFAVKESAVAVCYPGASKIFCPNGKKYNHSKPYFLFVGSLKRSKNIPTLLVAFAKFLKNQSVMYDLLLVGGDFWPDPDIKKILIQHRLRSNVKFLGVVSDAVLSQLYRGAVAFVSPSFFEGFCLPAIESMASGTPVIGSAVGSFPEVVNKAGILVQPTDTADLAGALAIMTDPVRRRAYAQMCTKRARKFSWVTFSQEVLNVVKTSV